VKRSKQQTRLRILDAAFGLFWRQGFLRVSMDEIAARAGITKRALYQHFPSKDDLMAMTLAHSSKLAIERLRAFPRAGEPGAFIETAVEQWLADGLVTGGVTWQRERAREIMLLTEGALALMLIHGDRSYAQTAARAAKRLVRKG
jgi:AcrR family transcriptional regulator